MDPLNRNWVKMKGGQKLVKKGRYEKQFYETILVGQL